MKGIILILPLVALLTGCSITVITPADKEAVNSLIESAKSI